MLAMSVGEKGINGMSGCFGRMPLVSSASAGLPDRLAGRLTDLELVRGHFYHPALRRGTSRNWFEARPFRRSLDQQTPNPIKNRKS